MADAGSDIGAAAIASTCNRRGFIARCAAAPAVVVAASGLSVAGAATRVKTYKGRYAIDSHRVINGYFASPRGGDACDVVLVIPQSGTLDAAAETMARGYAANGYLAIAPDLPSSYRAASPAGKSAMVAALMRDMPRLKRMSRGSGKVAVVAA